MHKLMTYHRLREVAICFLLIFCAALFSAPAQADLYNTQQGSYAVMGPGAANSPRAPVGLSLTGAWHQAKVVPYSKAFDLLQNETSTIKTFRVVTQNGMATDLLIELQDNEFVKTTLPGQDAANRIVQYADQKGVDVQAVDRTKVERPKPPSTGGGFGGYGPTLLLLIGMGGLMYFFHMRNNPNAGGANKVGGMANSGARKFTPDSESKKFSDVAGQDEAKEELSELVQFLKERTLLNLLGGKPAKGALLIGPPGTGKTLLAKAVAGEAGADFYSISGSNFVQMFVGVGAARVRDLFKQASMSPAAIIFIDEIDAVGRERGTGLGGGNDEREQTLNQLLAEMDGFNSKSNIIVLAATNRPDVLDPALTRPGRFDMQVLVDKPDLQGRLEILQVHTRKKPLEDDVDLSLVAKNTTGFTGAQLEGVADQAANMAFRRLMAKADELKAQGMSDAEIRDTVPVKINMDDIDEGIDRVMMGPASTSRATRMSKEDKENTAVHEVGHAWMAHLTYTAGHTRDPVTKITIVPRARALGYMVAQPEKDSYSQSKEYLLSRIMIAMGGRAAQEVFFGVTDGGAQNDFEQAWSIAFNMVTKLGMSRLGIISIGQASSPFLGKSMALGNTNASPDLSYEIEAETRRILDECYREALRVIERDRQRMQPVVDHLLEKETVLGPEFQRLAGATS